MRRWTTGLRVAVHIAALLPMVVLVWDFSQGQLTANPIREIQLRTGRYALVLLILSLACTPVSIVPGLNQVRSLRRPLGLYSFMYASVHFMNFIGLDYGFDFSLIREDIGEKRYALVGFAAFLILCLLAVTSTARLKTRLGKKWQRLHRLVYAAAALAILHFVWQVKANVGEPLTYGAIVALLLLARLPWIRKTIGKVLDRHA